MIRKERFRNAFTIYQWFGDNQSGQIMRKGPQGQKRSAAACGAPQIAAGKMNEGCDATLERKRSSEAGAAACADALSPEARNAVVETAAQARWKKDREMTITADPLAGLLFGQERTLVNLKLLRGDDPHVSEGELRAEAHSALVQVLLGNCDTFSDFPEDRAAKRIDVSDLVNI